MKNAKLLVVSLIVATAAVASLVLPNLFNSYIPDANETKLGIPPDLFAPSSINVNKGDTVTVHFYNIDKGEPHTFTIGAPYNIDKNVPAGQNATIVFKADYEGIFRYYYKYHLPTMQGQLIVTLP